MSTTFMATISVADWLAEGARRFGDGPTNWKNWKFQCPCCKHVATPADFEALGADPQLAYQECIGRHLPTSERASNLGGTPAANGAIAPCDYAAYGLFRALGGAFVQGPEGKPVAVLPFAEPEASTA